MNENFFIEVPTPTDKAAILNLLTKTDLPHDGVIEHLKGFLVARDQSGEIVACAGLERHGDLGLLRSVAVAPNVQKSRLGSMLVVTIIQEAQQKGITEIILLTTARIFSPSAFNSSKLPGEITMRLCKTRRNGRCRAAHRRL